MLLTEKKATEAGFEVLRKCENLSHIRNMRGRCLIVTDEYLMRGIDYRLKETKAFDEKDGIDLLVACPFSNERAYQQGLARVGRYNEPCTRYKLREATRIDEQSVLKLDAKLSRCR